MPTRTTSEAAAGVGDVLRHTAVGASELLPRPPIVFEDEAGRRIELRAAEVMCDSLVAMYDEYDAADRTQGLPPRSAEGVREWLDRLFESGHNLLAWHDDEVVGHATLVPTGDGTTELAIFVGCGYQHDGIGTRLLRTLLGYGRANGVERVWLTVARENHPAVSRYRALGFRTVERGMELEMERPL